MRYIVTRPLSSNDLELLLLKMINLALFFILYEAIQTTKTNRPNRVNVTIINTGTIRTRHDNTMLRTLTDA